jgi:hypothetical protein
MYKIGGLQFMDNLDIFREDLKDISNRLRNLETMNGKFDVLISQMEVQQKEQNRINDENVRVLIGLNYNLNENKEAIKNIKKKVDDNEEKSKIDIRDIEKHQLRNKLLESGVILSIVIGAITLISSIIQYLQSYLTHTGK